MEKVLHLDAPLLENQVSLFTRGTLSSGNASLNIASFSCSLQGEILARILCIIYTWYFHPHFPLFSFCQVLVTLAEQKLDRSHPALHFLVLASNMNHLPF